MAVRVLLVLAALGVLYGCGQASSPPERQKKQGGVEEAATATATKPEQHAHGDQAQKEIHHHDAPALLGDEQMAKLDAAGRKQLLACQREMVHDVWGKKQAAEEDIAFLTKQARKKGTTVQQEMWFVGYRCPEEIPGMEHMEVE
jgi:hypothetical protein